VTVYPVTFLELYSLCFTLFSIYIVKMYVKSIDRAYFCVQHLISYESFFRIEYIFTCPIYDEQIGHVVLIERFPYVFYNKN
jgi:hypothetical protein